MQKSVLAEMIRIKMLRKDAYSKERYTSLELPLRVPYCCTVISLCACNKLLSLSVFAANADLRAAHRRHSMRACMLNDFDTRTCRGPEIWLPP